MGTRELGAEVAEYLQSRHMPPTQLWLSAFLSGVRSTTPRLAIQKTAEFRIQAADLTTAVAVSGAGGVFPSNAADPHRQDSCMDGPIIVQLLDIDDIGRSRWSQVEALEAQERGEMTKGREIIRITSDENDTDGGTTRMAPGGSTGASGPHKLLLQDCAGTQLYALEMERVPGVSVSMSIGVKMVLRNVTLARGVLLLRPANIDILGGKVDLWDKKWREERIQRLKSQAGVAEER